MDVIIRNGTVRGYDTPVDVGIDGKYVDTVTEEIGDSAPLQIDASGGMILPSFVDPHTHLDKAFFSEVADPPAEGTLPELIDLTAEIKANATKAETKARIERAVRTAVANGTTKIRTHLDVCAVWDQTSVEAALEVKEECSDIVDIQTIAMPMVTTGPHKGLSGADLERLERALELGVDAVGGEPNKEATDALGHRSIDEYFELAAEYDADVDLHVDGLNSQTARMTEYIAQKTIEEGMEGRVQISHVSALAYYDRWHRRDVVDLIDRAGLDVVTTPKEDQIVADHDTTAVSELRDAGVNLSVGHNNISGTISPFGSLDMLEPAWLLAHVAGLRTPADADWLLDAITYNPARALGLEEYGISEGCKADITVCEESSPMELLRMHTPRPAVFKDGNLVASTTATTTVGVDATHQV